MAIKIGKPYNLYEMLQKADAGDPEAMFDVVTAITIDDLGADDPDGEIAARQIHYLKKLVNVEGYEYTIISLGDAYANGDGVKQDANEAIKWYQKAIDLGISFGNECIGLLYYEGLGTPVDYQKAFEYFLRNKGKLSFCTMYCLGEMYRKGLYVERDPCQAFQYYQRIVNSSDKYKELDDYYWEACYQMGVAVHYGLGTKKDVHLAFDLIAKAKSKYEARGKNARKSDISSDELLQEWIAIHRDSQAETEELAQ